MRSVEKNPYGKRHVVRVFSKIGPSKNLVMSKAFGIIFCSSIRYEAKTCRLHPCSIRVNNMNPYPPCLKRRRDNSNNDATFSFLRNSPSP